MAVLKNRAKMSTSTTGTGTITLGSAESGYQTFADAGVANGDVVRYIIEDTGGAFEIGTGTYTSSGSTLSRTVSESSNSDAAINLSGSATVFIGATAEDIPALYAAETTGSTDPTASGTNSIAIGSSAVADGTDGIAIGTNADAGTYSVSIGTGADGGGAANTVAIGRIGSSTFSPQSVVVGLSASTKAYTNSQTALGYNAKTNAEGAVALQESYAGGADSFAAGITTNSSSYGASGSNSIAMGYQSKSTGQKSVSLGAQSQATGNSAVALNYAAIASGYGSVSTGQNSNASASYSTVIGGRYGEANEKSKVTFGGGNWLNDGGTVNLAHQTGLFNLAGFTTDGTAKTLTTYDSTASSDNQVILPNNSAFTFTGTIIAREKASEGSDYASWEIKGALLRDANAGSTVLGNGIVNSLYHTSGASAWAVALSADTTNGGLKVQVTGAASTNIRWAATVNTSEVIYA